MNIPTFQNLVTKCADWKWNKPFRIALLLRKFYPKTRKSKNWKLKEHVRLAEISPQFCPTQIPILKLNNCIQENKAAGQAPIWQEAQTTVIAKGTVWDRSVILKNRVLFKVYFRSDSVFTFLLEWPCRPKISSQTAKKSERSISRSELRTSHTNQMTTTLRFFPSTFSSGAGIVWDSTLTFFNHHHVPESEVGSEERKS